jgi:hypothetical protein
VPKDSEGTRTPPIPPFFHPSFRRSEHLQRIGNPRNSRSLRFLDNFPPQFQVNSSSSICPQCAYKPESVPSSKFVIIT